MRILVTNDDGIFAPGLEKLVNFLKTKGEVIICAPLQEQSAKSHSIEIRNRVKIIEYDDVLGCHAYALDSTPADCVRYAVYNLKIDVDLVVSGINNGYNLGDDILYSGTCAAATEAALRGYKALALSIHRGDMDNLTDELERCFDIIEKEELLNKWNLWNINIPIGFKEYCFATQGMVNFDTYFDTVNGYTIQLGTHHHELEENPNTDVYNLHRGKLTITPLTCDRTKYF